MKAGLPVLAITGAVLVVIVAIAVIPVPQPRPDFSRAPGRSASAVAPAGAEQPSDVATAGAQQHSEASRDITWSDLIPKGWDPAKEITELRQDLSKLPDTDLRAAALLQRMRLVWDHAPTEGAMDGVTVRIAGYVVPLDNSNNRNVEFLLVPYFGACIHAPPPPANQIIHVAARAVTHRMRTMDTVWVSGLLTAAHSESEMGASSYRMQATAVEAYSTR